MHCSDNNTTIWAEKHTAFSQDGGISLSVLGPVRSACPSAPSMVRCCAFLLETKEG